MGNEISTGWKRNAWLAICFAIVLMTGETIRRFGHWGHWSWWIDDYFMGLLLITGALFILRSVRFGKALITAAWGFNAGLLYGSFFSKYTAGSVSYQSNINPDLLVPLIGLGFAVALAAMLWSLLLSWYDAREFKN